MTHQFSARNYDFTPFPKVRNWIGGSWVDGSGSETFSVINPRHGKEMASTCSSTAADVQVAVEASKKSP